MVRIRLRRTGKKKQPNYRLVVADARSPRDGKFIEIIGHYNPVSQPKVLEVKDDRARYWLSVGAQPSDPVVRLLQQRNVIDENRKVIAAESTTTAAPVASAPTAPAPAAAPAAVEATPAPVEAAPAAPINPVITSTDAA